MCFFLGWGGGDFEGCKCCQNLNQRFSFKFENRHHSTTPPLRCANKNLRHANATNMGERLHFLQGNYNDPLPFADETFDALYQVQVLTYTIDPEKLFKVRGFVYVMFEEMEGPPKRTCKSY